MAFKQYLFLLPVVAVTLFAYCTKETPVPASDPKTATEDPAASDRTKCLVTVTVNSGSAQVCGTNTMVTGCSIVNGEQLFGVANLVAGFVAQYGIQTASGATPSGYLQFTNTAPAAITSITVTTATGSVTFQFSSPNQVQNVAIDAFCVPTLI